MLQKDFKEEQKVTPNVTIIQTAEAVSTYKSERAFLLFDFTTPMFVKEVIPAVGDAYILISYSELKKDELHNGIQISYTSGEIDRGQACQFSIGAQLKVLGQNTTACEGNEYLFGGYPVNEVQNLEYKYYVQSNGNKEQYQKLKEVLMTEISFVVQEQVTTPEEYEGDWVLKRKVGDSVTSMIKMGEWQLENGFIIRGNYLYALTSHYKKGYYSILRLEFSTGKILVLREFKNINYAVDAVSNLFIDETYLYYTDVAPPTDAEGYFPDSYKINAYRQDLRAPTKETKIATVTNDTIYGSGWFKKISGRLYLVVSGGDACYGAATYYLLDTHKKAANLIGKYESSCEESLEVLAVTPEDIYLLRSISLAQEVEGEFQTESEFELLRATVKEPNHYESLITQREFPRSNFYSFEYDELTSNILIVANEKTPFGFEYDPRNDVLRDLPRSELPVKDNDDNKTLVERISVNLPSNYYWEKIE